MFKKQVAIVTGASRGIGQAIALALARERAIVIGTSTNNRGIKKINKMFNLEKLHGYANYLNVNKILEINKLIKYVITKFGKINILINNAGIIKDQLAIKMKDIDWNSVINTNLNGTFYLSRSVLRPMIKAKNGRIINITSIITHTGNIGQSNYSASKAGIEGMTKSIAYEIGKYNITINCIAPGFIETDMTKNLSDSKKLKILEKIPLKRFGNPFDIANAVIFLASPKSSYITGSTIHINGGSYM